MFGKIEIDRIEVLCSSLNLLTSFFSREIDEKDYKRHRAFKIRFSMQNNNTDNFDYCQTSVENDQDNLESYDLIMIDCSIHLPHY